MVHICPSGCLSLRGSPTCILEGPVTDSTVDVVDSSQLEVSLGDETEVPTPVTLSLKSLTTDQFSCYAPR